MTLKGYVLRCTNALKSFTVWLAFGVWSVSANPASEQFCQRLQSQFMMQALGEPTEFASSAYTCEVAPAAWAANMHLSPNHPAPILVKPKTPAANSRIQRVLLLSPKWSKAYDETSATIIEQFYSRGVNAEYILVNYLGDQHLADIAIENAEMQQAELIYSVGSPATEYLSLIYAQGAVPVVSACSKDPYSIGLVDEAIGMSQHNIAYTSLNISVETQVSYLKEKFLEGLNKIAVIYDTANSSSMITQVDPLADYLKSGEHGIELEHIAVDMADIDSTLFEPMRSVVNQSQFVGDTVFLVTGSTELFNTIDAINRVARTVPVLSVTPSHVNEGEQSVFVAIGVSFKTNARLAADYGMRILEGSAKTQSLPVGLVTMPDISINFLRKPSPLLKVPFNFFEDSSFIYDYNGKAVRQNGVAVRRSF